VTVNALPGVLTTNGATVLSELPILSCKTTPLLNEQRVTGALARLRASREARRRLDLEERGHPAPPEILTLRERLARPREHPRWAIHGWQPANSRVLLAAQFEAGKTTLVGNYLRSRVDGDPWLGVREVTPLVGTLALLDFEMAPSQLDDWLEAQRIREDDRVLVVPMRGHAAPFDIPHDLRRSAIRSFVRAGLSEHVAMRLSGHLTSSAFRRYEIVSPADLRVAVERLDAAGEEKENGPVREPGPISSQGR
jgi:AAA domain